MKRLIPLLLICALLCGCTANAQQLPATQPTTIEATQPTQTTETTGAAVETEGVCASDTFAALPVSDAYGILSLGESLVILSGTEGTVMTLVQGEDLTVTASRGLEFFLDFSDPGLRVCDGALTYFDPVNRQTVILDEKLSTVGTIAAPEDLVGSPILSSDRNSLYYCTAQGIRAWDLESGIRRMLKEVSYPQQMLSGLHCGDQVIQCIIQDENETTTLFVSAADGELLAQQEGTVAMKTLDNRYYANFSIAATAAHVFGTTQDDAQMLLPQTLSDSVTFLPEIQGAAVTSLVDGNTARVQYYDLASGCLTDTLEIPSTFAPAGVCSNGEELFILMNDPDAGCYTLHRWQPSLSPVSQIKYTGTYTEKPDTAALASCQAKADQLGAKYGIQILVGEAAAQVEPWDYDITPEYLVPVILRELELLEQRLADYPEDLLSVTASHFQSMNLCLVREITGTAESGSLENANGLQFLEDGSSYVAIAVGEYSQQALYHELYHVMETHILTNSTALDTWEALNPEDFAYSYSLETDSKASSSVYLTPERRAFVDSYSMSFPVEDRARIFENAMLPGKENLFQTDTMQAKLQAICQGIRESYDLPQEPCLWEQYLRQPMV